MAAPTVFVRFAFPTGLPGQAAGRSAQQFGDRLSVGVALNTHRRQAGHFVRGRSAISRIMRFSYANCANLNARALSHLTFCSCWLCAGRPVIPDALKTGAGCTTYRAGDCSSTRPRRIRWTSLHRRHFGKPLCLHSAWFVLIICSLSNNIRACLTRHQEKTLLWIYIIFRWKS